MTDEEARAIAWQNDQQKRARKLIGYQRARAGNPQNRAALQAAWEPLRRAYTENGPDNFDGYEGDENNA